METSVTKVPAAQMHAWLSLRDAQAHVQGRIDAALADSTLPPAAWLQVLRALDAAPDRQMRMFEVAERLIMSRSGLTRLVDRLERDGLIERHACPSDRRGLWLGMTEDGRTMLAQMLPVYEAAVQEHFAVLVDDPAAISAALQPILSAARGEDALETRCKG